MVKATGMVTSIRIARKGWEWWWSGGSRNRLHATVAGPAPGDCARRRRWHGGFIADTWNRGDDSVRILLSLSRGSLSHGSVPGEFDRVLALRSSFGAL